MKREYLEQGVTSLGQAPSLFLYGASFQERLDVARRIHLHSMYSEGAFIAASLMSIPRGLRAEKLFGSSETSWASQARGGTLFIDELDCLCADSQEYFIRLLKQDDVRVIVSSRYDPVTLVRHGALEETMLHWLSSLAREHCWGPERLRAVYSLGEEETHGGLSVVFEPVMRGYVRTALEAGSCTLHANVVSAVERPLITMALKHTGGNQIKAASLLGLNRNTLRKRIRDLHIVLPKGGI